MLLEILEGQESYISAEKLRGKDYFMYPAYYNALLALINTVKQRRRWEDQQGAQEQQNLADCSVTNIITFAAPRGGGKTSAMRSFANAMEEPEHFLDSGAEDCEVLRGAVFRTLPLISPSVLRPGQGILPVVLARMYRWAEELWQSKRKNEQSYPYGQSGSTEMEKSDLLYLFQQCLSGVNAIKSQDGTTMDLSRLHELSDGAALRQSFYTLTQRLLRFAGCPNGFLVLQLDDADSQVGQGYEVLEDVRKYLMIPNLIILMAADFSMLRTVVFKHHYMEFQNALENGLMAPDAVKCLTGKYLDKLIPPLNLVYLPRLEQFSIQYGDGFQLRYLRDGTLVWASKEGVSFQSQVLAQIYQKTGLVFVSHTFYQNNIIPTTLRGLKQLLELLEHMQNIPKVTELAKKNSLRLASQVKKQAKVAVENLSRFSEYFTKDWIDVKITDRKDRAFLEQLARSPASDRLHLIRDHLEERCPEAHLIALDNDDYSHAAVDEYIEAASMKSRRQEDYLFFFAIRTILSLDCHRNVWLQKEKAAIQCREDEEDLLIFPLDPEPIGLTDTYYIRTRYKQINDSQVKIDSTKMAELLNGRHGIDDDLTRHLFCRRGSKFAISYIQVLNIFLCLGTSNLWNSVSRESEASDQDSASSKQCLLYNAQEAALFVASNWEVQRRLLVNWSIQPNLLSDVPYGESEKAINSTATVRSFLTQMDWELSHLNQGTIWSKKRSEGLGAAFRALCAGQILGDLDFGTFLDGLYSDLSEMA